LRSCCEPRDQGDAGGRRYLDLQREAKRTSRPADELFQLYALECFLDRLVHSEFAEKFVLKGGVLLAALEARRPTRDIDLAARALDNSVNEVLTVVRNVADIALDDGLEFDSAGATADVIREEDHYSGVRVSIGGQLSRASVRLHVDVSVGDPIWPEPQQVRLPRLLEGELFIRGYPLEMVLAEKIVTAIARGSANTRWRDFVDIYVLARRHSVRAATLRMSIGRVAQYRHLDLAPLRSVFVGYAELAQQRWLAWLRKNRLDSATPTNFSAVLDLVQVFADPVIVAEVHDKIWDPVRREWVDA
jgi:predicted nucleotidyltransferase component of viral defense system